MSRPASRRNSNSEKEGLLDHLLPEPTHPRAGRRALALSVVSIFFLLAIWLAMTDMKAGVDDLVTQTQTGIQSWVYGSAVEMGGSQKGGEEIETTNGAIEEADESADNEEDDSEEQLDEIHEQSVSNFAKYLWHRDLEWDADGSGRLIVIGDVHGMVDPLKIFLKELDYSPETTKSHNDTLVFVGDLVAKHPDIKKSLEAVDYIRSLDAYAVRGNHDQDVINWRNWMDTSASFNALSDPNTTETPPADTPEALKHKWRDEHYRIAQAMSDEAMAWMMGRSLTLHIRSLHTYIVHAGLLPWTIPKSARKGKHHKGGYKTTAEESEEILAGLNFTNTLGITPSTSLLNSSATDSFVPVVRASSALDQSASVSSKLDPEMAILTVPLNRQPFTLLEMRGYLKNGKVTKSNKKGVPWAPIWNEVMAACHQSMHHDSVEVSDAEDGKKKHKKDKKRQDDVPDVEASKKKQKQCRPLSVVYGHAAARGLDLRPFSFGLDSAAVTGGSFSALVVEGTQSLASTQRKKPSSKLQITDVVISGRAAKVYSMKTKKPKS